MRHARQALSNFIASACLYAGLAYASHVPTHTLDAEWTQATFWAVFGAVQLLVALGYAMSSLPKWGRWVDGEADTEYKLTIIVGIIFAVVAGNIAYYISFYEANVKHLYCFLTALAGGFAGEKWLGPFLMRLLPVQQTPPKGG